MKVRIISGVVGGILAILILILHKTFVFPLAIAALICIALFELFRAGKCLHCRISIGAGFLYGAALPFLQYYGNTSADNRIDIPLYRCDVCRNGFAA